jgi:tRNA-2-methylthio-N6-dimethylallyladenosine synthase
MENNNKHYFIKTYGCQMNIHESEKLAGMLISLGYTECSNMKDADVIVFNTCCIRDGA